MTTDYKQQDDVTKRVRFYDGQFLQDQDFIDEQKYHLDREARLGRSLQVAGIVDGLVVTAAAQPFFVHVSPGTAVDLQGRAIVLAQNRTGLDQDGLPILMATDAPVPVPAAAAGGERLLYIAYYQMPADMQQSQQGLQSETRWQEAPYIFIAAQPVGADDEYGGPPWDTYLTTRPTPVLLARLQVGNDGAITVNPPRIYSGLRLPGPGDGASWVMDEKQRIQLRYGQEDPTGTPLTIAGTSVGIGTADPAARLEIIGTDWTSHLRLSNIGSGGGGPALYLNAANRDWVIIGTNGSAGAGDQKLGFYDATGGAYRMVLDKDGNFGIGTTAPGQKLTVSGGNIQLDGPQKLFFTDGDTSNNLKIQLWTGYGLGINGSTLFYAANGRHSWRDNAGTNERMVLTTGAAGGLTVSGTGTSSFAGGLNVNGNVGIGTAAPAARLEIIGTDWSSHLRLSNASSGGGGPALYLNAANRDWAIIGTNGSAGAGEQKLGFYDATGGAYRMVLDKDGNFGIGTTAPGQKLTVSGGNIQLDGPQKLFFTDGDTSNNLKIQLWTGYGLGINGGTLFYAANGRHSWRDNAGTYERMALTTSADGGLTVLGTGTSSFAGSLSVNGNVGIGTAAPAARLEIIGTDWSSHLRLSNTGTGGGGAALYLNAANRDWAIIGTNGSAGAGDEKLGFYDVTSAKYRMVLDKNGNLGIGTPNPQAALHLHGNNFTYFGPNSGWGAYLQVGGNGRVGGHASVHATNGNLHIDARDGGYSTYINYYSENNTIINDRGGNVGIGTAAPSQKLDVNGNVKISGSGLYNSNSWAIVQCNQTDWLRINPNSSFPATAIYNPVAIGTGGLAIGSWARIGQGQLQTTSNIHCGGDMFVSGRLTYWWGPDGQWKHIQNRANNYAGSYTTSGPSDLRLKTNLRPVGNALEKVQRLQGKLFNWSKTGLEHFTRHIPDSISAGPDATQEEHEQLWQEEREKSYRTLSGDKLGLVAQQVEEIVPELVFENEDGYKHIRYSDLTALLVEAVKEQQATIQTLLSRVNALAETRQKNGAVSR